jgi:hypothetical protein
MEGRDDRFERPNLSPPEEGFGLWRHKNADQMDVEGCPNLYRPRAETTRSVTWWGRGRGLLLPERYLPEGAVREALRESRGLGLLGGRHVAIFAEALAEE